jgi:hypothetical protein
MKKFILCLVLLLICTIPLGCALLQGLTGTSESGSQAAQIMDQIQTMLKDKVKADPVTVLTLVEQLVNQLKSEQNSNHRNWLNEILYVVGIALGTQLGVSRVKTTRLGDLLCKPIALTKKKGVI